MTIPVAHIVWDKNLLTSALQNLQCRTMIASTDEHSLKFAKELDKSYFKMCPKISPEVLSGTSQRCHDCRHLQIHMCCNKRSIWRPTEFESKRQGSVTTSKRIKSKHVLGKLRINWGTTHQTQVAVRRENGICSVCSQFWSQSLPVLQAKHWPCEIHVGLFWTILYNKKNTVKMSNKIHKLKSLRVVTSFFKLIWIYSTCHHFNNHFIGRFRSNCPSSALAPASRYSLQHSCCN